MGQLTVSTPGQKVVAVFGFCDIRQFTGSSLQNGCPRTRNPPFFKIHVFVLLGITECLQQDIMVFVNQIAEILHADVHLSGGAPNKNIGDAFLFVWKLQSNYSGIESLKSSRQTAIAENALGCFIKCALHLQYSNENGILSYYRDYPKMRERFGKHKQFLVRLGFGLHVGWAIEGAIGSKFKIDVSYLSPHVNIAARLEAATKQYKVDILFSDNLFQLFSPTVQVRKVCRPQLLQRLH